MIPHSRPTDTTAPLLFWQEGGVAQLRFNRPSALNAISFDMAQAFHAACRELAADSQVRVVVLSGEGRAFMAGGDLPAMATAPTEVPASLIAEMHPALEILASLRAPVIASVHGAVAGGGLGVALACDLVVAAEGTRFNLAYPLIGTSSDCGTSWGLVRWVGLRQALEIALLAEPIDASQALAMKLINRVVPSAELANHTAQLAQRLAQGAPLALGNLKQLMRRAGDNDLSEQLALEERLFRECAATQDFAEGMAAFLAKRPAKFVGR